MQLDIYICNYICNAIIHTYIRFYGGKFKYECTYYSKICILISTYCLNMCKGQHHFGLSPDQRFNQYTIFVPHYASTNVIITNNIATKFYNLNILMEYFHYITNVLVLECIEQYH